MRSSVILTNIHSTVLLQFDSTAGECSTEACLASDESVPVAIKIDPKLKLVAMAFKIQDVQGYGTLTYVKIYQVGS